MFAGRVACNAVTDEMGGFLSLLFFPYARQKTVNVSSTSIDVSCVCVSFCFLRVAEAFGRRFMEEQSNQLAPLMM